LDLFLDVVVSVIVVAIKVTVDFKKFSGIIKTREIFIKKKNSIK
jgi:hypothetical protein